MSFVSEKINEAQRQQILTAYKTGGVKAATALCVKFGLNPRYYSSLASSRGVAAPKSRPLTKEQKEKMRAIVRKDDAYDYRWKWAIERGAVVA